MLTDDLTRRMREAADAQPFVPDITSTLVLARQLRRRHRIAAGGGAVMACALIAVAAAMVVSWTSDRPATVAGSAAQQQVALPVQLTTRYDTANDVTCLVLTFTETGDNLDAGCSRLDPAHDAALKGIVGAGGFNQIRVRAGAEPTTIAIGEVSGGGTVLVTDETGREIRAAIVSPPAGYPFAMYYADLGPGLHWPTHVTYIAPDGKQQVFSVSTQTPRPTTSPTE